MKKQTILSVTQALLLSALSIPEIAQTIIPLSQQTNLNIAIYNQNIALVDDVRTVSLTQGINDISFEEISAQLIPESALLKGTNITTLEQNFNYDLITRASLLEKSIGQNVILQTTTDSGEKIQTPAKLLAFTGANTINADNPATVLSALNENASTNAGNSGAVLEINNQIVINPVGTVLLNDMPHGLISRPSLNLRINAGKTEEQKLHLNYLTNGLSWQANYVALLNENEDKMNLNGYITLSNQTNSTFKNADLQLVAGDVKTAPRIQTVRRYKAMNAMAMDTIESAGAMPTVEDVADFYVYTLPTKTTVNARQTKQVSLLTGNDIGIQKTYVFNYLRPSETPIENAKATIHYQFNNTKDNQLGIALPAGIIRFYKNTTDGKSLFVGENRINHTPNTAMVKMQMGDAFDVYANAKQTEYQRIGKRDYTATYEITFKNGSKNAKEVILKETYPAQSSILKTSYNYTQENAGNYQWKISVPAEGETVLSYQVKVIY